MQPVEFTAGLDVGSGGVKQPAGEGAGGLFSGASGPKPPPALSQAVIGMKPGGKVSHTVTEITWLRSAVMPTWQVQPESAAATCHVSGSFSDCAAQLSGASAQIVAVHP